LSIPKERGIKMTNEMLRQKIKKSRLFHYEVAEALRISESAFSKLLRTEMDKIQEDKVISAINKIIQNGGGK
jgi:predicted XRE-type DNA-binding protein